MLRIGWFSGLPFRSFPTHRGKESCLCSESLPPGFAHIAQIFYSGLRACQLIFSIADAEHSFKFSLGGIGPAVWSCIWGSSKPVSLLLRWLCRTRSNGISCTGGWTCHRKRRSSRKPSAGAQTAGSSPRNRRGHHRKSCLLFAPCSKHWFHGSLFWTWSSAYRLRATLDKRMGTLLKQIFHEL